MRREGLFAVMMMMLWFDRIHRKQESPTGLSRQLAGVGVTRRLSNEIGHKERSQSSNLAKSQGGPQQTPHFTPHTRTGNRGLQHSAYTVYPVVCL